MKTENAHSTVCCVLLLKISTAKRGKIVNTEMLLKGLSSSLMQIKYVPTHVVSIALYVRVDSLFCCIVFLLLLYLSCFA